MGCQVCHFRLFSTDIYVIILSFVAGYNSFRAVCGLAPATTFEELVPHISVAQARLLLCVCLFLSDAKLTGE